MGVAIPIIPQTVGTPSGPGPRMSSPPPSLTPVAAAVEPLAEGGEHLGRILAIQGEHQKIIDAVKTHEQAKTDLTQQQLDIQANNPPQLWASKFKEFADDYAQKTLADPANAHIKNYLGQQMPQITGLMYRDMLEKGVAGTQALQHQQFELMGKPLSRDAGAAYLPESFKDAPAAEAARRAYYKAIDLAYPNSPQVANLYKQTWEREVVEQRAENIAIDPSTKPGMLEAYLKTQPFTPEQKISYRNMRIGTIESDYHLATANHEAQVAHTEATLDQMATAHDPGIANAAYKAKLAGFIDTQKYENYTHSKWRDPYATSEPGLVATLQKDIDQNPFAHDANEIAQYPADTLTPDDRRRLTAYANEHQAFARKAVGGEYLRALDTVRHSLTPNIVINEKAVAARVDAALTSLRAAKEEGQFQTVKDVQEFTKQVLATYTVGKAKKPVEHVVAPTAPPVKLPPAIAAKIAAEARASGWEPGE